MPQQAYTAPPPPQVSERVVFGRAPQVAPKSFGGPSGDGGFDFSSGYDAHEQHEQHRQQQQQRSAEGRRMSGQGSVSSDATDSKVVPVALYLLLRIRVFLSGVLLREAFMT